MFSESKQFISRKQSEIQELRRECETLGNNQFQIGLRAVQAKDLSDDLNSLRLERD
jgi:methylthioribose-1-phosphate isomerase